MLVFEVGQRRKEIIDGVDHRLQAAASVVKYLLEDDFHDRAVSPNSIGIDEERMNRQAIKDFKNRNGFEWVYTVVEQGGNYYFTAPSVSELEAMERKSWYFYPFDEIPSEFADVFITGIPAAITYSDGWGTHRSVALKERSPLGNVYISCVEYNISTLYSEVSGGILSSVVRFAIVGLAVIPFLFLNIVYSIRINRLNFELNEYRQSLEGLVDARTHELTRTRDELIEHAIKDSLTGVYNRRFMTKRLEEEMGRHTRNGRELTMMVVDLDHFKLVNDRFGHIEGDRILKDISDIIKENLREHDVFGRYGGDEFLILLPETDISSAKLVGEKLLKVVDDMRSQPDSQRVTLSIGSTEYLPGETVNEFLSRADFKMYEAKKSRNTVFC
ncbi:MAG: GGDEF domain-containing protein [Spirochaetales bacterium]|nr:GGDEF domain-containing protein [Spirochaetales bacterium]